MWWRLARQEKHSDSWECRSLVSNLWSHGRRTALGIRSLPHQRRPGAGSGRESGDGDCYSVPAERSLNRAPRRHTGNQPSQFPFARHARVLRVTAAYGRAFTCGLNRSLHHPAEPQLAPDLAFAQPWARSSQIPSFVASLRALPFGIAAPSSFRQLVADSLQWCGGGLNPRGKRIRFPRPSRSR